MKLSDDENTIFIYENSKKNLHLMKINKETQPKNKDSVVLKEPSLDFQKALQQARMANKMSQKDLALKLGMNLNTMVNYEKGKEIPTNLIISKLEKLLNTKLPRIQKKIIDTLA